MLIYQYLTQWKTLLYGWDRTEISAENWVSETKCPDWMKQSTLFSPPPSILSHWCFFFHLQSKDIGLAGAVKGIFISDCCPLYLIINWNKKHSQTLWNINWSSLKSSQSSGSGIPESLNMHITYMKEIETRKVKWFAIPTEAATNRT